MAWIDVALPSGGATWDRPQSVYYNDKIYVPDGSNLRAYTVSTNTWSTIAMPNTIGGRSSICVVPSTNDLYISGNTRFYKYNTVSGTFTSLATGAFNTTSPTGGSTYKRLYYYNKNTLFGTMSFSTASHGYNIDTNTWFTGTTLNNANSGNFGGGAITDPRYSKFNGFWFAANAGGSNTFIYRYFESGVTFGGSAGSVSGGYGYKYFFSPTALYQCHDVVLSKYTGSGNFTTLSTDFGETNGPACWAEGYVFHWNTGGTAGKKWTPEYKVSGSTGMFTGTKIVVYDNATGIELGRTWSAADGSWDIGLESTNAVDIMGYYDGQVRAHTGVTPVVYS